MIMDFTNLVGKKFGKYHIIEKLGEGGYGVTYKAKDEELSGLVAIKIIKNQSAVDWKEEAKKAAKLRGIPQIATVFGIEEIKVVENEKEEIVKCIIWEYVEGTPLAKILEQNTIISSQVILDLTEALCRGIKSMQEAGLEHRDLHAHNIIFVPAKIWDPIKKHSIKIVDFGLAKSVHDSNFESDMEYLKHILQQCWKRNQFYEGEFLVSDKKFQGLLTELINRMCDSNPDRKINDPVIVIQRINQMYQQSHDDSSYSIPNLTHPFEYLSAEEMPENTDLLQYLYTDNVPWLREVIGFGTTIISGPRGSGKSMILKNMRLLTKIKSPDFAADSLQNLGYLGFYLHCQHNLYFPFAGVSIDYKNSDMLIHYFNLLYTSEIIDSLTILEEKLVTISTISKVKLTEFLIENVFQGDGELYTISPEKLLIQCKSIIEKEILLAQKKILKKETVQKMTTVSFLKNLIQKLDELFEFFRSRHIYFLLDDFSDPKVPYELQKSLNRIIGFRNERFCFKISTEKFGFTPIDSDGKILQQDREFSYIDLGARFINANRSEKKDFIKKIIEKRLERSNIDLSVEEFFGPKPFKGKIADALLQERIGLEGEKHSRFLYASFDMIYRLCSGDVSTMLQLCKQIYLATEAAGQDLKKGSSPQLQDQIIRDFSKTRLNQIKEMPELGTKLFHLVETFGNISKKYLYDYSKAKKDSKFLEVLRLELTENTDCLSEEGQKLFRKLITEHIFLDGGATYPWGNGISNIRLILRPIFTPALKISYSDRYSIKIGCALFEKFLTSPNDFERSGTKFLRELSGDQITLDQYSGEVYSSRIDEDDE